MKQQPSKTVEAKQETRLSGRYPQYALDAMKQLARLSDIQIERAVAAHEYWQCLIDEAWANAWNDLAEQYGDDFDDSNIDVDHEAHLAYEDAVRECGTRGEHIDLVDELLDYLTPMGYATQAERRRFRRDVESLRRPSPHGARRPAAGSAARCRSRTRSR